MKGSSDGYARKESMRKKKDGTKVSGPRRWSTVVAYSFEICLIEKLSSASTTLCTGWALKATEAAVNNI